MEGHGEIGTAGACAGAGVGELGGRRWDRHGSAAKRRRNRLSEREREEEGEIGYRFCKTEKAEEEGSRNLRAFLGREELCVATCDFALRHSRAV